MEKAQDNVFKRGSNCLITPYHQWDNIRYMSILVVFIEYYTSIKKKYLLD